MLDSDWQFRKWTWKLNVLSNRVSFQFLLFIYFSLTKLIVSYKKLHLYQNKMFQKTNIRKFSVNRDYFSHYQKYIDNIKVLTLSIWQILPGLHSNIGAWFWSSTRHWLNVSPVIAVKSDGQSRKWASFPWQLSFLPNKFPTSTFDEIRSSGDWLRELWSSGPRRWLL